MAPRRREARPRPRAHGGGGARRARRPRARQRPLPHELLGHEGLRRLRLPARGRARADHHRGVGGGRRAHGLDGGRAADHAATTRRIRARRSRARSTRPSTAARDYERVGLELSLGTQASDRMVGEPTTFTAAWFDAFPDAADATPLLVRARAIKTEQELERLRLANEIAAAAMEHVREQLRPGMKEAQAAALWQGFVHGEGTGCARQGRARAPVLARLGRAAGSRRSPPPATCPWSRASPSCSRSGSAPTATGPTTRRTSCVGELKPEYAELESCAHGRLRRARSTHIRPGASMAELDRHVREQLHEPGTRASRRIRSATASARGRTSRRIPHQAGGGEFEEGMVLAVEPGVYWAGGGGLRVEDNFLVTARRRREALLVPGRSGAMSDLIWTGSLNDALRNPRRTSACTTRRCATASRRSASSSRPRRSSRSRGCSTGSGSSGSRPASRACRRTTGAPSS